MPIQEIKKMKQYNFLPTLTKLLSSVPVMLLHLLLITLAMMWINPFLGMGFPQESSYKIIRYYIMLVVEVSTVFLLVTMPFRLKIKPLFFFLILLCCFFSISWFPIFFSQLIIAITKNYNSPLLDIFYDYGSYIKILPLLTYLAGYINKKLFWSLASITIACFCFDIIWFFILSDPLYWDHLLDGTFTQ